MISKELLSEIIGHGVRVVVHWDDKKIQWNEHRNLPHTLEEINIHELAHKCKGWALDEGYEIVERKSEVEIFKNGKRVARFIADKNDNYNPILVIDYACQWVFDKKVTA